LEAGRVVYCVDEVHVLLKRCIYDERRRELNAYGGVDVYCGGDLDHEQGAI
jgi:hypothetical protein